MSGGHRGGDPLLAPYLEARGDEEARERLGHLLAEHTGPLLWRIIRRQLGHRDSGFAAVELEDLHASTLLKLQLHLDGVRSGEREAPASYRDYVAIAGYNAVAGLLMARQPERTRLRDRVRYVLRSDATLAAWSGPDRDPVCGRAAERGRAADAFEAAYLVETVRRAFVRHGAGWGEFTGLVRQVLGLLGAPCRLEALVDALAEVLGIRETVEVEPSFSHSDGDDGRHGIEQELAVDAPSVGERMELVESLQALWNEVDALPVNQRIALLFSLRDGTGDSLVDVLVTGGAVSFGDLAAALELGEGERERIFGELPWDDLRIAARLGLERQQVINLRKSARLRLARRLRGRLPGLG